MLSRSALSRSVPAGHTRAADHSRASSHTRVAFAGAALAAAALALAACSSSGGSGKAGAANTAAGTGSGTGSAATVTVRSGPDGSYLADGAGRALYMFASDTATKSTCSSSCLAIWPPFDTSGTPTAGSGATAADLSTITGTNGKKQVVYAGHPLYYYAADSAPGQTNGQGVNGFGAKWWLMQASGQPITSAAPSASSSSGGKYGYP